MKKIALPSIFIFSFLLFPIYSNSQTYCKARGNDCNFNFIAKVELNTISNESPCTNYGDYHISHATVLDADYTLIVTWGGDPTFANYVMSCYIDFNHNGLFTDVGEEFPLSITNVGVSSTLITVPSGALPGKTRMRIRMVQNAKPAPCGDQSRGEVEDYSVVIPGATNTAPKAGNDNYAAFAGIENEFPVLFNDDDDEGNLDSASVSIEVAPANGLATVNTKGRILYTPKLNFYGKDSLTYKVCDKGSPSLCDNAIVYLKVVPSDSSILATPDNYTFLEFSGTKELNVLANDFYLSGGIDSNGLVILTNPTVGTAVFDTVSKQIVYMYQASAEFTDSLEYKICDDAGFGNCDSAWAYIKAIDSLTGIVKSDKSNSLKTLAQFGNGNLKINLNEKYNLIVFDIRGSKVFSFENAIGSTNVSIENFPSGLYIISINTDQNRYINKYLKH